MNLFSSDYFMLFVYFSVQWSWILTDEVDRRSWFLIDEIDMRSWILADEVNKRSWILADEVNRRSWFLDDEVDRRSWILADEVNKRSWILDEVKIYLSLYSSLQVNFIRILLYFSHSKVWAWVFWMKLILPTVAPREWRPTPMVWNSWILNF
jgi:hypothetical protein